jgi:isoleucyl-tRNA synthetase
MERWTRLLEVRAVVSKELEILRAEKKIGQSLEAAVRLSVPTEIRPLVERYAADLPGLFIVSRVTLEKSIAGQEIRAAAERIDGAKCERCWSYPEDVRTRGANALCGRCGEAVGAA